MANMNMIQALNSAIDLQLQRDPNVLIFGEDVGYFGGVFRVTDGLQKKHGAHRVFDAPLAEGGIAAIAMGMGLNGLRPVAEIQFADYIFPAYDQIVNEIAKLRHRSGGEFSTPVTFRTPAGGGIKGGHHHSQSPEAQFTHTPGLKVVYCSNPYNAKGLLTSAIECNDPIIFFEPKRCYRGPFYGDPHNVPTWKDHPKGEVPEEYYDIPLEQADLVLEGGDCTVIAWGAMVHVAQQGIEDSGISCDLLDLQTLVPWDRDAVVNSVNKTGRCVIVHEAPKTSGFGAEMAASVQERCFWKLEHPIQRVAGWDTPFPHTTEWDYMPSPKRIADAIKGTMEE
ncbi:MAG TPA: alpha-ketoacid dehydrogenase subunit beta [Candidatus Poseidoniales archaeon]|nr:MAG: alpha-ketoacid dehydrogenase subunit beta [Euryarchaeota archaeon]HIA89477.1 alpha-ketoacid dehydrogenase subunit beta [Candidatus Poseidoniales archaeon]HIO94950.1 alpha-ketoacid dehydrogenase subunit beta [Candidatus Poseidoniales archaeon]